MSGTKLKNGDKGGRPSIYTDALVDRIIERISAGEPLQKICNDADMPNCSTVQRWRRDKPEFTKLYLLAREEAADSYADRIMTMANELIDRREKVTREEIQAVRVAIDALKWAASKLRPSTYGDMTRHAGHDAGPLTVAVEVDRAIQARKLADAMRRKIEAKRAGDDPGFGEDELSDDEIAESVYPLATVLPKTH
ncbi:MAG: hypothetical protein O7I42_13605 [Alphaproteobacteria bacterium]|nr:hypothetical protein [Alphaproteobacteria bacterium]